MLVISFILCLAYLMAVILLFGMPASISESFYLLERRRPGLGYVFSLWCWTVAVTVMSVMLAASEGRWYQFLGLFAGGGLGFVGAAPLFKGHERAVHYVAAGVCATAALGWMVCAGHAIVPAVELAMCGIIAAWYGNVVFWIETGLLLSVYATILTECSL